jgi:hypothetical protein
MRRLLSELAGVRRGPIRGLLLSGRQQGGSARTAARNGEVPRASPGRNKSLKGVGRRTLVAGAAGLAASLALPAAAAGEDEIRIADPAEGIAGRLGAVANGFFLR